MPCSPNHGGIGGLIADEDLLAWQDKHTKKHSKKAPKKIQIDGGFSVASTSEPGFRERGGRGGGRGGRGGRGGDGERRGRGEYRGDRGDRGGRGGGEDAQPMSQHGRLGPTHH